MNVPHPPQMREMFCTTDEGKKTGVEIIDNGHMKNHFMTSFIADYIMPTGTESNFPMYIGMLRDLGKKEEENEKEKKGDKTKEESKTDEKKDDV